MHKLLLACIENVKAKLLKEPPLPLIYENLAQMDGNKPRETRYLNL